MVRTVDLTKDQIDELEDCAGDLRRCVHINSDIDTVKSFLDVCREKQAWVREILSKVEDPELMDTLISVNEDLTDALDEASQHLECIGKDWSDPHTGTSIGSPPSYEESLCLRREQMEESQRGELNDIPSLIPEENEFPKDMWQSAVEIAHGPSIEFGGRQDVLKNNVSAPILCGRNGSMEKNPSTSTVSTAATSASLSSDDHSLGEAFGRESCLSQEDLWRAVDALRKMKVRDRKFKCKTYKSCFLGSDAVTAIIRSCSVQCRTDAVLLGRKIAEVFHLFEHVEGTQLLEDKPLLYIFTGPTKETSLIARQDQTLPDRRLRARDHGTESNMPAVIRALQRVEVKDRRYKLSKYKRCFVGSEAVDMVVEETCVGSREEAVEALQRVADKYDLFEHVSGSHHKFKDEHAFYHFKESSSQNLHFTGNHALKDDYLFYRFKSTDSTCYRRRKNKR